MSKCRDCNFGHLFSNQYKEYVSYYLGLQMFPNSNLCIQLLSKQTALILTMAYMYGINCINIDKNNTAYTTVGHCLSLIWGRVISVQQSQHTGMCCISQTHNKTLYQPTLSNFAQYLCLFVRMPVQGRLKGLKVLHNSEMLKINEKFVPPSIFLVYKYYTVWDCKSWLDYSYIVVKVFISHIHVLTFNCLGTWQQTACICHYFGKLWEMASLYCVLYGWLSVITNQTT